MVGTELMPSLVGGDTERVGGKLKKGNRFLEPNFGVGPSPPGLESALKGFIFPLAPLICSTKKLLTTG